MPEIAPSDGVGLCLELNGIYQSLDEGDNYKKLIDDMSDKLLENCKVGNKIERKKIPKYYITNYGVNNLYRYHLQGGFRGIYTVIIRNGETYSWILDVFDHNEYDKRFGY